MSPTRRLRLPYPLIAVALVAATALGLLADAQREATAAPDRVDVLITFDRTPGPTERALVQAAGGTVTQSWTVVPGVAASLPSGAIAGLSRHPRILAIEPDGVFTIVDHSSTPGDAELNNTWGVKHIGAGPVHLDRHTGAGVLVAVLDSGARGTHLDLAGRIDPSCSHGFGYSTWNDGQGHGTHVAGTVAANRDGARVVGAAPEATLCILKVLADNGSGDYSDVITALDYVAACNSGGPAPGGRSCPEGPIKVTNNSYGSTGNPGSLVEAAFVNSANTGVLHIAAAGNEGTGGPGRFASSDTVIYPARWSSLMAVAATTTSDSRASFSSVGSAVEIAAPGSSIRSTDRASDTATSDKSGTSMASPHVAGVAALIFAASGDPSMTPAAARQVLRDTAKPLGSSTSFGYGLVQAGAAVQAVGGTPPPNQPPTVTIASPANGATVGGSVSIAGTASDDKPGFSVTLTVGGSSVSVSGTDNWTATWDSTSATDGSVTIVATATDSNGAQTTASVTVTVTNEATEPPPPPPPGAVDVTAGYTTNGGPQGNKHLTVTLTVVGDSGPVSGASVSFVVQRNGNTIASVSGTTSSSGAVSTSLTNHASGTYTVANVSVSGYESSVVDLGYTK